MRAAARRLPTVGTRAAVGLVLGATLLGAAVGSSSVTERHQLPGALTQLTTGVIAEADALACLQGVQDDLFIDTRGDIDAASVAAAQRRFAGCPITAAVTSAEAVSVPAPPPLEAASWRKARAALASGAAAARRGALDIKAAAAATGADLVDHQHGTQLILAYRAAYSDYMTAGRDGSLAQAFLAQATAGAPRGSL